MTPYETIYKRFLQKITDFKLLELSEPEVMEMLYGFLLSAISKFKKCANDLSERDDESKTFSVTLLDIEIEILSILMVVEWLEPQLNSVLYTSQFFGGKDEKFFAQANQLDKLMALKETNERKARKLMRDYTYKHIGRFLD